MPNAMVALATTTLGSAASSVTFGSIPATYRDLRLVIQGTNNGGGASLTCVLNSDTGSNYSYVRMQGSGSGATSQSGTLAYGLLGDVNPDLRFFTCDILDYSATDKHKSALARYTGYNDNVQAIAWRWASTSAVTSIVLAGQTGSWNAGSTFSLYGVVS